MNDLDFGADLRAALNRDADLVGAPSPDLLARLLRRRAHQRRQRLALTGAVGAVVLIGAGFPVGVSLAAHSGQAPATQPIAPTPSVSRQVAPTPPAVTPTAPAVTPTPTAVASTPTAVAPPRPTATPTAPISVTPTAPSGPTR